MQATGRLAAAAAGVLLCVALLLQGSGRGGVVLEGKDASPQHAIKYLASLYSEPCQCSPGVACKCVTDSAAKVAVALDNAVAREFGPPNMYYRTKNGYSYRLRPFQKPPAQVANRDHRGRVVRPQDASVDYNSWKPKPKAAPKPVGIAVSAKYVDNMSAALFFNSHHGFAPLPRTGRAASRAAGDTARFES
ncbi:hypothetical protein T484DRAFT_1884759, partial [Baffinella frigidus]